MGRTALLVYGVVVKVPSLRNGIKYFVMGMLANILERERWTLSKHPMLAPVYWCAPFGLVSVQKRCEPVLPRLLTSEEVAALPFIGYDNNGHNAAITEAGVVLVDYGNPGMYLIVATK